MLFYSKYIYLGMICFSVSDLYGIFQRCGDSGRIFGHGETDKLLSLSLFSAPFVLSCFMHKKVLFWFINICRSTFEISITLRCSVHYLFKYSIEYDKQEYQD